MATETGYTYGLSDESGELRMMAIRDRDLTIVTLEDYEFRGPVPTVHEDWVGLPITWDSNNEIDPRTPQPLILNIEVSNIPHHGKAE